jgi:hypothetical protein
MPTCEPCVILDMSHRYRLPRPVTGIDSLLLYPESDRSIVSEEHFASVFRKEQVAGRFAQRYIP